jgi:hypothetical protein
MKQNRIEKWAQGKRKLISATAISIASGAEGFYSWANAIKDREVFDGSFEMPRLDEWLSLYKNHRRVEAKLREAFEMLGGPMPGMIELNDNIDEARANIKGIDPEFLDQDSEELPNDEVEKIGSRLKRQLDTWAERQDGHIFEMGEDSGPSLGGLPDEIVSQPEIMFGFFVTTPCWLLYYQTPARFLRKARSGDIEAIETLLRFDPSTIFDKKIAEHVHRLRAKKNAFEYKQIVKSLHKPPKGQISRQRIKLFCTRQKDTHRGGLPHYPRTGFPRFAMGYIHKNTQGFFQKIRFL